MELAIVLPVLVAMTLGIIAFGWAMHVQTVLDNAAREGVRIAAISTQPNRVQAARQAAVAAAAPALDLTTSQVRVSPSLVCVVGTTVRVEITLDHQLLGGIGTIELTGHASMRCGG